MIASNLEIPLPLGTKPRHLADSPDAPHATPRTLGILVVDDEAYMRGMLNVAMRQQGFAVWLARDGQHALEVYRRHHETIDAVLMDVRMPRLDGAQTLAALQELNPRIRCCFMSGDPGRYTEGSLRNTIAATVFQKPFRLDEAAQVLWELASKADGRPASL